MFCLLVIFLDCTRQQIEICHNQCIYTTICITLALGENTSSAVKVRLLTFLVVAEGFLSTWIRCRSSFEVQVAFKLINSQDLRNTPKSIMAVKN